MFVLLVMFIGVFLIGSVLSDFRKGIVILNKPQEELEEGERRFALESVFVFVGSLFFILYLYS